MALSSLPFLFPHFWISKGPRDGFIGIDGHALFRKMWDKHVGQIIPLHFLLSAGLPSHPWTASQPGPLAGRPERGCCTEVFRVF